MTTPICPKVENGRIPRRVGGFTMIELMVTVSIVAIFATLAAPSFQKLISTQRVRAASSAINESLFLARSEAIKRNAAVGFTFTTINAGWDVKDSADATVTLHHQDGFPVIASEIKSGTGTLIFNAYGRLVAGGAGKIELKNSSAGVVGCVTISLTGRSTLQEAACS